MLSTLPAKPNLQGHTNTRGEFTIERCLPTVSMAKHKINTQSSTESELVGANDMMSLIIWMQYLLKSQGYKVKNNIIFQDNKSMMLLESNGTASSGEGTKHINLL